MKNEDIYKELNEGDGLKLPSYMGIIPRNTDDFTFSIEALENSLRENNQFVVKSFEMRAPSEEEGMAVMNFNFDATIGYQDIEYQVNIAAKKTEEFSFDSFSFANTIDENSLKTAKEQPFYLEVTMYFEENPMISFLLQLKVLHTIMPSASLVLDFSSMRLLSPYWLEMTANSNTPPSPNYLYIVHGVYDEKEDGTMQYWMHTHGLHRCGSMELELVNIKGGADAMYNLINFTANQFIMEHHKENESFQVGYDGLGINLCWLRWEEALKEFPEDVLGGKKDRATDEENDYNVHASPSGVLFAVEEGNYTSPEIYASTLADNPIYFVRADETHRMSALAAERFHLFENTYNQYGIKEEKKSSFLGKLFKKKEEETDWQFLVKLGLFTDDAKEDNDKEHLWYEVQNIENGKVTGKLLNQPYWIAALNEGDIKTYPIDEVLTDWIIYGPEGSYTPDSIYLLA